MQKCDVCHYHEAVIRGLFSSSVTSKSTRLLTPPSSPAHPYRNVSPIRMERVQSAELGFGHDLNPLLEQEFEQIREIKADYDHIVLQDEEYVSTLNGLLDRRLETALDPDTTYSTQHAISELEHILREKKRHREVLLQEQERLRNMKNAILQRKSELEDQRREKKKMAMLMEVKRELLNHHLYPAIKQQSEVLLFRRMETIVKLFRAMPIEVDAVSSRWDTLGTKVKLRGFSSIMGMPLPNHGHFDAMSVDIVSAALARVAQLTEAIATAMNIPLPHPILTNHHSGNALIVPMYAEGGSALPLSPISWNVSRDSFRDFQWMSLDEVKKAQRARDQESLQPTPQQPTSPAGESDIPKLRDDIHINSTFTQALLLLQADVISLCIKLGLSAAALWPPSALLLNLHVLKEFVEQYVTTHTQEVALDAPSIPSSPPRMTKTTFYLSGSKGGNQKSNPNSSTSLDSSSAEDILLNPASLQEMETMLNARFLHATRNTAHSSQVQIEGDDVQDDLPLPHSIIPDEADDGWDVVDFDD